MKERRNTQPLVVRCKLVLVGDVQCGKTAMLQVLAKDCYPEVCPNAAHVCEKLTTNICMLRCCGTVLEIRALACLKMVECGRRKSVRMLQTLFMRIFVKFRPLG